MKRLLREPLFHFLILGALLFWVAGVLQDPSGPGSNQIIVTTGQVELLAASFSRTWQRPPTPKELDALIDHYVREEICYREAIALGLDQGDPVVRGRMRQKLEFLTEGLAPLPEPTDSLLRAFLGDNVERYRVEPQSAFRHIYLNRDDRGDRTRADAGELLDWLKGMDPADVPADAGDAFLLPLEVELSYRGQIARIFGDDFAEQVTLMEPGRWVGPIESGFGLHIVFVHERIGGSVPPLEDIRFAVENDWRSEQRRDATEKIYQKLREGYTVFVRQPPETL